jgi:hypothetical protein
MVRYKARLPVIFHWCNGGEHTEGGFTSDVALNGAFIRSAGYPSPGSEVKIEILIPSPVQGGKELRICCKGKVKRVVDEKGLSGFGVAGSFDDRHLFGQTHDNPRGQQPENVLEIDRRG